MNTTVERVRMIAPNLDSMPDETLQLFVDDAIAEVKSTKDTERLQRYLAAHLATASQGPQVTSERIDSLSVTYQALTEEGLLSTPYGQEYLRLSKKANGTLFNCY